MSDEQFRRPGSKEGAGPFLGSRAAVWQPEITPVVERTAPVPSSPDTTFDQGPRGTRTRNGLVLGAAGLLVGLTAGAIFIDTPAQTPLDITLDTFPTEIFGQQRDDIEWRTANSAPVVERLDAQFKDQLTGYRFAYGGAGAEFTYAELYTLAIVNGRLAPEVPISDDSEWSTPSVISLNSGETSCVSTETPLVVQMVDEMGFPGDPAAVVINGDTGEPLGQEGETPMVWTECVFFDDERNLGLRLTGRGKGEDMLSMAARFRDELVTLHAGLIG